MTTARSECCLRPVQTIRTSVSRRKGALSQREGSVTTGVP